MCIYIYIYVYYMYMYIHVIPALFMRCRTSVGNDEGNKKPGVSVAAALESKQAIVTVVKHLRYLLA